MRQQRAATHALAPLEHDDLHAGASEQRRGHQAVDAGADYEGVRDHDVRRSSFYVRRSSFVVRGSWFGMVLERRFIMPGVRRYEDLEAWQLADELKREVYALTESGAASKDFDFRDQIRASAASSTKNIAEGFGRFRPAENAHFVEFSVASTMETKDSLRSIQCSTRFIVYLKSCKKNWRPPREPPATNDNDEP
jgi:four helix bundle protein